MTFDPNRNLGCEDDDQCHGGYRMVTEAYVDRHAPSRPVPHPEVGLREPPDDLDERATAEWRRHLANNRHHVMVESSMRTATANSVYPCHVCNPDQFLRWSEGDWPNPKRKPTERQSNRGGDRPPMYTDDDAPPDDGMFDPGVGLPADAEDRLTAHEHERRDLQ